MITPASFQLFRSVKALYCGWVRAVPRYQVCSPAYFGAVMSPP